MKKITLTKGKYAINELALEHFGKFAYLNKL